MPADTATATDLHASAVMASLAEPNGWTPVTSSVAMAPLARNVWETLAQSVLFRLTCAVFVEATVPLVSGVMGCHLLSRDLRPNMTGAVFVEATVHHASAVAVFHSLTRALLASPPPQQSQLHRSPLWPLFLHWLLQRWYSA